MPEASGTVAKEVYANGTLHLFSLYADFPASVCTRWAASQILKIAGPPWRASSEMWKLDSLTASAAIKNMAAGEAARADVIIVAVSSLAHRLEPLIEWFDSLAAPESSRPGLLIALLGNEENQSQELDWTVKQLIRCARQTNRHFIWHWMEKDAMNGTDWLKDNIEELLLQKLAANREPALC